MKIYFVLAMSLGWSVILAEEKYSSIFDMVDINMIFENQFLRNYYISCLLYDGFCFPDAYHFKKILPEAIATRCGKCTQIQKNKGLKVLDYLKNRSEVWNDFLKKYDPDGRYHLDEYEKYFEGNWGR